MQPINRNFWHVTGYLDFEKGLFRQEGQKWIGSQEDIYKPGQKPELRAEETIENKKADL
jgi:hypothetical protein